MESATINEGAPRELMGDAPRPEGAGETALPPALRSLTAVPTPESSLTRLARRVSRAVMQPSRLWGRINAQVRIGRTARTPWSVLLFGRAWAGGGGEIVLGERVSIRATRASVELLARPHGCIDIGADTFINYGVSITAYEAVSIGRGCHIGHYVFICDNDEHDIEDKLELPPSRPVILEDGVWLGTRVNVLKGVRIGHDAVVGAGSVVTHDIPPRCVAAGVPARVIRRF